MKAKPKITRRAAARRKAPERGKRGTAPGSNAQLQKLLYELQVHSEEITVQNEQLMKAQAELEQARDRYADLYDFAPVGYVSIDGRGTIVDINLAGASLLGLPRTGVTRMPFAIMIAPKQLKAFRAFLIALREHPDGRVLTIEVSVRRHPNRLLRLVARPLGVGPGLNRLLVAMFDVTEERRLEAERGAALERGQQRSEQLAREVTVRTRAEERIKALLERLVSVQEEERRRIARNLHDQLGQRITALRLSVSALKDDAALGVDLLQQRIEAIDRIAAQIDRDVDGIAWDLRPASLDDMGLNAALEAMVRDWSDTRGVRGELHVSTILGGRLPPDMESHLYRIVQEALNNVAKHAGASRASVLLKRTSGDVEVIVEDDGCGFDVESVTTSRGGGMGLSGIQERASLMGGHFEVESTPGAGTTLFVRVPVQASAGAKTEPEGAEILRK